MQQSETYKKNKKKKMIMRIGFTVITVLVIGISYFIVDWTHSLDRKMVDMDEIRTELEIE